MAKAKLYKTMPMKKIGGEFWRFWSSFGSRKEAELEKGLVKRRGWNCRITKRGSRYAVWYLPSEQGIAKRDYERFRKGV